MSLQPQAFWGEQTVQRIDRFWQTSTLILTKIASGANIASGGFDIQMAFIHFCPRACRLCMFWSSILGMEPWASRRSQ